jgi:hypothetical protein
LTALRRRLGASLAIALALVWWTAAPAGADPPRPTNYRSTVRALDPEVDGVRAEVVGGDGFLELTVEPGHEVTVLGYEDEPYLRFKADGTVEENRRSPAVFLNRSRQGGTAAPPSTDAKAKPAWTEVADGGRWAWHDHRIHWMGAETPVVDADGRVTQFGPDGWSVPLEVDGTETLVRGDLVLTGGVSPLPTAAVVVVVAGLVMLLGWRRQSAVAGAAVAVGALLALGLGWAEWSAAPPGGGASPVLVILPVMALAAAVGARFLRSETARAIASLTSAAAVGAWLFMRIGVVTHRVLPTSLDPWIDRLGFGAVVGATLAAVVLTVRSGALAAPAASRPPTGDTQGTLSP